MSRNKPEKNEKPECKDCLYAEYDYDGKETRFLMCAKFSKCEGTVLPRRQELQAERGGHAFRIIQYEWMSYVGKTVNLVVFVKKEDGEFYECMHSGHFGKFLETKEDINRVLDFVLRMRERGEKRK